MINYSRHAKEKLRTKEAKTFKIGKRKINKIIEVGTIVERQGDVILKVGELDFAHSLCVVYKSTEKGIRIITFFPARKGRYERKILQ